MGYFRYTPEQRKAVRARIKELSPNYTYRQIVEKLSGEGFKRPDGRPLTTSCIAVQAYGMRRRRKRKSAYTARKQYAATVGATTPKTRTVTATKTASAAYGDRKALSDLVYTSALPKNDKLRLLAELL